MKCVNHPDRDATAQCYKCMKLLCDECRILSKDGTKAICRPCLAILKKPPVTEQTLQSVVQQPPIQPAKQERTKFCKYCGGQIPEDAVLCTICGRQVEQMQQNSPNIVINNDNHNVNTNHNVNQNTVVVHGNAKNKWVALVLCIFLGYFGAHKFYEGKTGMGILYLCTVGLCLVGVILDIIALLAKPTTYYI